MAISPKAVYPGQTDDTDPDYPLGKARNATTLGDGTGFPFEQRWVNDHLGFLQALLAEAGVSPSGSPDRVGASDYLDALNAVFSRKDDPVLSNLIWFQPDIDRAYYSRISLDISGQDGTPRGIAWHPDGTKLYLIGSSSNAVHQYTAATPWDLDTVTYDNVSLDVSAQGTLSQSVFWSSDGTKLYVARLDPGSAVNQYTAATPWDLSTVTYDNVSLDTSSQTTLPECVAWSPDGTKLYISFAFDGSIRQYTAATPWDLDTVTYDSVSLDVSGQSGDPNFVWSSDGTKLYVTSLDDRSVHQYTAATPWDLDTVTYDSVSLDVSGQDDAPYSLALSSDGTKLYMVGSQNDHVHQYYTTVAVHR